MDLKEIRQLIKILSNSDVSEIEVSTNHQTVRIQRALHTKKEHSSQPLLQGVNAMPMPVQPAPASVPVPAISPEPEESSSSDDDVNTVTITSPMVGTFYRAPSPSHSPFVNVEDVVKKGQVICIIEAMKLMNEIESEFSGRITKILVNNASPVEYGEALFIIEPV